MAKCPSPSNVVDGVDLVMDQSVPDLASRDSIINYMVFCYTTGLVGFEVQVASSKAGKSQ